MKGQQYSRANLDFTLVEVHDILSLTKLNYFSAHDAESFKMVLDAAEEIAEKTLRPFFKESDRQPPTLIDGKVKVHPAVKSYYAAFCESGLMTAPLEEIHGGQQLPKTVFAAADFILGNAHNGFEMFSSLAQGAIKLLTSFASKDLIDEFVPKIVAGEYAATMCLTETQAGSSLGDIATEATQLESGSYRIKGQKIFISAGDHDVTEDILHLALARVKGAPKGIKGVSLFAVPKNRNTDGQREPNDVTSVGIIHKMGQRSTPAMHLEFGAADDCIGNLIGEEGKGLSYMFQMMNTARLGVGLAGTYIASAAYYASLEYAKERPQGRRLNDKNIYKPQVTIIHHPDVRRMLFLQKAFVEGALSFVLQCHLYSDLEKVSDDETKELYKDLQDLLTPVAKTVGAEMGIASVNNGMQTLGGYGYTEDFILEQLARDVRIMSLYEGTTGIQSQTLLGREVGKNGGRAFRFWKEEVAKEIASAKKLESLCNYADQLSSELLDLTATTDHLLGISLEGDSEIFLSDATWYMELFGFVNLAWQWLKQAVAAERNMILQGESSADEVFYQSKIETMKFYFHYELIKTKALHLRLRDKTVVTVWKEKEVLI